MQSIQCLIDYLYFRLCSSRGEQFYHLGRNFFVGKRCINFFHIVYHLFFRQTQLGFRFAVCRLDGITHPTFFQQGDGCTESDKLLHACHVYSIIIGVTHLRRRGYDDDFLRMQTVEDADDTLLQGSTAHDAVVDNHQIVFVRNQTSVRNIIYMGGKVVAGVSFGDECTQLNVFYSHLLAADTLRKNLLQLCMAGLMPQSLDALYFQLVQIVVKALQHAVKGYFRRIGNKREHGMNHVIINSFQYRVHQFFT